MKESVEGTLIDEAVRILRAGGLVALPTETVYGLGADASNAAAVRRIFAAKGRPADHPLIVHVADIGQIDDWARDIPDVARTLAQRFWPGPMTLILKRAAHVIDEVTGGQDSVGLRIPSHPVAQTLLRAFGGGIAAPSANRFGRISPTTAEHVRAELGSSVDLILDGGPCEVGIESTILDLSSGRPVVLRPGQITVAQLEEALGESTAQADKNAPRASGTLEAHYAPSKPLLLLPTAQLEQAIAQHVAQGPVAVLSQHRPQSGGAGVLWRPAAASARSYAQSLYAVLRDFDAADCAIILVETPPQAPEWLGVWDRLRRSAAGSGQAAN